MKVQTFPACCTGMVVTEFGGSTTGQAYWANLDLTVQDIEEYLKTQLLRYKRFAFLCATTNQEQEAANVALSNLGFYSSEWMSKDKHAETQVKLWWKPLSEYREQEETSYARL